MIIIMIIKFHVVNVPTTNLFKNRLDRTWHDMNFKYMSHGLIPLIKRKCNNYYSLIIINIVLDRKLKIPYLANVERGFRTIPEE